MRIRVGEGGHADEIEQLPRPGVALVARDAERARAETRRCRDAVRQGSRRGSWKTSPTRWSASATARPSIGISPASGRKQARDQSEQRALAGAVRSDDGDD